MLVWQVAIPYFEFGGQFLLQFPVAVGKRQPGHLAEVFLEALLISIWADEDDLETGTVGFDFVVKLHELRKKTKEEKESSLSRVG